MRLNTRKLDVSKFNAVIGARGYGQRFLRVLRVSFALSITANESETKEGGGFYPRRTDSSSFTLGMVFTSHQERVNFGDWIVRYGRRISAPSNPYGPMRVIIPSRWFDRTAVPTRGIQYGDRVDLISYPMTIPFRGARTPLELESTLVSKFQLGKKVKSQYPDVRYFYPGGKTLTGNEKPDRLTFPQGD